MEYMAGGSVADLVGYFYLFLPYVQCLKLKLLCLKPVIPFLSFKYFFCWGREKRETYAQTVFELYRKDPII